MSKNVKGLGYDLVKAVNSGEMKEPLTYQKVKTYCEDKGLGLSDKYISVILPNATENPHSPNYKKYFKRVDRGKYVVLDQYRAQTRYYWLNINSAHYNWTFSGAKTGIKQAYSSRNEKGNTRKNENCFRDIKIGDRVLAYETGELQAITALCEVVSIEEEGNERLVGFQKVRDYSNYLHLSIMKKLKSLKECKVLNSHVGTLFELEKKYFNVMLNKIEEINSENAYYKELEKQVQKSKKGSSKAREERLSKRESVFPERFERTVQEFKRNPDVIAEVLSRANGICEQCDQRAPFLRASDGTPYLEVHHKVRLADGGADTVENAIAVCPNCHRELHFG